jgi:transcription elongation factor Elf1
MTALYIEISYSKQVGAALERFRVKRESPFLAAARCPICGDSAKSKSKTRFIFYERESHINVMCHNCGYSSSVVTFLKNHYNSLYNEYIIEKYRVTGNDREKETFKIPVSAPVIKPNSLDLPLVKNLPVTHIARQYVDSRNLPEYGFQFAEDFYGFCQQYNSSIPETKNKEPRLIIPFFDRKGNVFAFQGRDLTGKSKQKYITITIDDKTPKIFGIDRLDVKQPVIIVEGPIDSLFLPNCIASVNASLVATAKKLTGVINKTSTTLVYDNEPRNKIIVEQYQKAIDAGYPIVIWSKECEGLKDVNDMILAGIDVKKVIKKNTFSGIMAKIKFLEWKKV